MYETGSESNNAVPANRLTVLILPTAWIPITTDLVMDVISVCKRMIRVRKIVSSGYFPSHIPSTNGSSAIRGDDDVKHHQAGEPRVVVYKAVHLICLAVGVIFYDLRIDGGLEVVDKLRRDTIHLI